MPTPPSRPHALASGSRTAPRAAGPSEPPAPRPVPPELTPAPIARPARSGGAPAGLRALVDRPQRSVIALDFDGTLADIVPDPMRAAPRPGVEAALATLGRHQVTLVVVTGRPALLAVELGRFDRMGVPLTVLGHYGAERFDTGTGRLTRPPGHPGVPAVRAELTRDLAAGRLPCGVHIEDKGNSVAVHTRQARDPQGAHGQLLAPLTDMAARHGLTVEVGRLVTELRPGGTDKGRALAAYLDELEQRERPEEPDRQAEAAGGPVVLYAGDDRGDVAAFQMLAERHRRGEATVVLVHSAPSDAAECIPELADFCDLSVPGPAGVTSLLTELAGALEEARVGP
ncbi:trehalose-phosphatase [Streptomyces sp. NPDC054866]